MAELAATVVAAASVDTAVLLGAWMAVRSAGTVAAGTEAVGKAAVVTAVAVAVALTVA